MPEWIQDHHSTKADVERMAKLPITSILSALEYLVTPKTALNTHTCRESTTVMNCQHPYNRVTADINEGDCPVKQIQWCQVCGAYRYTFLFAKDSGDGQRIGSWRLPQNVTENVTNVTQSDTSKAEKPTNPVWDALAQHKLIPKP